MCICKQTTIECDKNERGVSCSIRGYPTKYLPAGEVNLLQQLDSHSFKLANRGGENQLIFHHVNLYAFRIDLVDITLEANCNRINRA
jgi:hypothetical protein